jgi:hypothetical protein
MQVLRAFAFEQLKQAWANTFINLRRVEKPGRQRAQIKACAADQPSVLPRASMSAMTRARAFGPSYSRKVDSRFDNVNQVMRDTALFCGWDFGGRDVQAAIDLHRIAIDDFTIEAFGECEAKIAFAGSGRADYCNQWGKAWHVHCGR